ncbi:TadE/TadG family type IV pilus assembly protein [Croceicoccus gelatinilyticus]|uniref:TadE/TadG family type IV pilus assembly protein n=1 Tax=Croceicoccus gelatinilyticus TaxID=2835536 RepID=UPI001BCE34C9|nr:TadE/TadG family type IV pilus assembly protein [Croceicoccus gelatinilyticus]MBS7668735.1 pilus assembly protein [Croceicoccus gelatinilyticus]
MNKHLSNFRKDESGTTIIEMAVLLPVLITMLIGVFQAGMYLQAQNAVRGVAGEMSRYMAVEAQKSNFLTDEQIETKAMTVAVSAPYMLHINDLQVFVENEETQSMDRVRKIDLRMVYDVPNLLGFTNVDLLQLEYTRSVFVPGNDLPDEEPDDGTDPGTGEEPVFGT